MICSGSTLAVSAGTTWINNLASSDPDLTGATYAWTVNTAGTTTSPTTSSIDIDFSTLSDADTVVVSLVATAGGVAYNSE
jgi:hypothetical protein